jgi:hypothetical protein
MFHCLISSLQSGHARRWSRNALYSMLLTTPPNHFT